MPRPLPCALVLLALAGCASEPLLHGLDEPQANEVLVALDEGGVGAEKRREEGSDGGWLVVVRAEETAAARRILAARELPRPRPPGFGEVFAGGGMVPTPVEEHARYLHALSGELSRSLEALDGVVGARVHLGLPVDDPLRPGERRAPRAAVLLRCRPEGCAALRGMQEGIRSLVAGAADGLAPDSVSILLAEAAPPPHALRVAQGPRWRRPAAGALAVAAATLVLFTFRRRLPWPRRRPDPA